MRILLYIMCLGVSLVQAQQSLRIELLGHWNDTSLASQINGFSQDKQIWNDLTGWTDPRNGKEYIIIGSIDSTYFFDVSNPSNIIKCAVFPGRTRSVNRDYETYKNYVYCVSDSGPPGVLQILDLQYLPDSVHVILEDSSISSRTHSIFIDSTSKRLYMQSAGVGTIRYDLLILSLDTPEKPRVIGELRNPVCGRVHEAYYRNDTAYCSCEYRGLHVFNMQNPDSIIYMGGIAPPYPYNGYNHTSWLDPTGKFLVFTDEIPKGLPIKLYSVKNNKIDFDFEAVFNSNQGATPHNVFWVDNFLYTSAYEDGVVIWNMKNPYNPKVEAYYDTYEQNQSGNYKGFTGCWGVYPFFKSGVIAASDMRNGLFLMKYNQLLGLPQKLPKNSVKVYPNPFSQWLHISIENDMNEKSLIRITNITGQIIQENYVDLQEGENDIKLENSQGLVPGIYTLHIVSTNSSMHFPIVKH